MAQNENYSQIDLRVGTEEQFNAKVGTLPAGTLFGVTDSTVSKADLSTDLKNEINGKQASLSADQLNACNSGITSAKVSTYDGYQAQINGKVSTTTYSAETRYGVAKIWKGTDNYLYIRTDGH